MKNIEIPSTITLNEGRQFSFDKIFEYFSNTKYGQNLASEIRYKRYNLDTDNVSNKDWQRLLGIDVNNLKHMPLTYGLGRSFLKHLDIQFSAPDQENFLLACNLHDIAEAVKKDITFGSKTKTDDEEEIKLLHQMSANIFSNFPGLNDRLDYVVDTIIGDHNSELGKPFNAVERLGYLRTGLRAFGVISELKGKQKEGLEWLTTDVLLNQIPTLIEYSKIYRPVDLFLKSQKDLISEAFETLPESVFKYYDGDSEKKGDEKESVKKEKQYQNAKQEWQNFVLGNLEQKRQSKNYQEILDDLSKHDIYHPQQIPIALDSARGLLKRSYSSEEIIKIHTHLMHFSHKYLIDPNYQQEIDKDFELAISFRRDLSRYFWEIGPLVYSASHDYRKDSLNLLESANKIAQKNQNWRTDLITIEEQNKLAKLGQQIDLNNTFDALKSLSENPEVSPDALKAVSTWSTEATLLSSPLTVFKGRKSLIALGRLVNESLHDFYLKICRYNLSPDYLDFLSSQLDNLSKNWIK